MKHLLQNKVWKECIVCSLGTLFAFIPSILGVHSGGRAFGSDFSVNSIYLSLNSSGLPLSGNMLDIACVSVIIAEYKLFTVCLYINVCVCTHIEC